MIRDIQIANVNDGFLRATIDGETISWSQIKKIIKKQTQIYNNQDINTSLYDVININMFLAVIDENENNNNAHSSNVADDFSDVTTDKEENIDIDSNNQYLGMVDVPIYDADMNIIGYQSTPSINNPYNTTQYTGVERGIVHITISNALKTYIDTNIDVVDGLIQAHFQHNLPLGEYQLTVSYPGNKYYEGCVYTINFQVDKRLVQYQFTSDKYEGYPNNDIYVRFQLTDVINQYPVQCNVQYFFNDQEYVTSTDSDGKCVIHLIIPDIDKTKCTELMTNDSIYAYSYPLIISLKNDNYKLKNDITRTIYALKLPTEISVYSNDDDETQTIFEGNVMSINDTITNVQYGDIVLSFDETDSYYPTATLDENGHFSIVVDVDKISLPIANNPTIDEYYLDDSIKKNTQITIDLPKTEYYVGDEFKCHALVEANINATYQTITEGMVIFILTNVTTNKVIYQHICEVDDSGEAEMIFELSTIGSYKINATYYGMFEYKSAQSESIDYTVGEV